MARQQYPLHHRKEVWNAPLWVFAPGVSLTSTQAAHELGFKQRRTLLRHVDEYGLTVYRHPTKTTRHFLKSEIAALKKAIENLTSDQVKGNGKRDGSGLLGSVKTRKRGRKPA